jgi:hypothetical protein
MVEDKLMWVNAAHDTPTDQVVLGTDIADYYVICDERALDVFKQDKGKDVIYSYYTVVCCQTYDILSLGNGQTMQQYVDAMFDTTIEWEPEGE